jgi:predicted nucleic acid-binding protein
VTLVVDASVAIAALTDGSTDGEWSRTELSGVHLFATAHMPFEVSNVLRRMTDQSVVSPDFAALALRDLIAMPVDLLAHDVLALRIWELRHNLGAYDAAHVAAAELVDAPLATLDRRLAATPGTRCEFRLP